MACAKRYRQLSTYYTCKNFSSSFNRKPTTRKLIKVLLDNGWVMTKTGVDKREKLLSLTDKGQSLFETINKKVTVIQQDIIKTGLTDEQVFDITNAMSQIHEAMIKEEQ